MRVAIAAVCCVAIVAGWPTKLDMTFTAGGRIGRVQTGISTLPEVATTIAAHNTGKLMKLPISIKVLYGEDQKIRAVEATFYPSRDEA